MNVLFWTSGLKIFIKDISSLKNTIMFLKHTYSQPTRNCLSVTLLFDDNRNNFFRYNLLLFVQPDSEFLVNGPEQKMEADKVVKIFKLLIVGIYTD